MKNGLLYLFLVCSSVLFGQDAKEVLKKMQDAYNKHENLEYTCKYELFKGHQAEVPQTVYDGYMYKEKEEVYQRIDKAEMIYGKDFFLKVNNNEKAMVIEQQQTFQSMNSDLEKSLNECRSVELEEKGDYYAITMTLKSTSQIPYSVVKLKIEKKKYFLTQMDLYYTDAANFSEKEVTTDMAQPHLKISFNDTTFSPKGKSELLTMTKYLVKNNSQLELTQDYKEYELIDNRIK